MSIKRAITALQKYYPTKYAESSWDNTGLLVDSLNTTTSNISILLTVDLTKSVVEEALANDVKLIIAYHPFIFRGIKKIEPLINPQHDSLIKLIQAGISVYSPHTAVDAAQGGVNDWLAQAVGGTIEDKKVIIPNGEDLNVGMGRVFKLKESISIKEIITNVKKTLGLQHVQLASIQGQDHKINTIAVCAGSGSGVFSKLKEPVDLYLTGELSHHEVLALKESGANVITTNHSNTERGYLQVIKDNLTKETDFNVLISSSDADPLIVV